MSIAREIAAHLPYLRRYARALTGSQQSGDAYVAATLEALVSDPSAYPRDLPGRLAVYKVFVQLWSSANNADRPIGDRTAVEMNLDALTPLPRQAFLLRTVEGFSLDDVALILGKRPIEAMQLVEQAGREIAEQVATSVLIIEDEPLISMQLEDLVASLGHTIFGTAATRSQALEVMGDAVPGLVLADIQLADGSSGLDAVDDILAIASVPVIFITAYPERLLTGDRPEPTYLVTKPFQEATVRAAISQALFFGSSRPL